MFNCDYCNYNLNLKVNFNMSVKKYKWDCYTAGPIFTPKQHEIQNRLIKLLKDHSITSCDPRTQGPIIADVPREERGPELFQKILNANCDGILNSKFVIACIDDRDTGTIWELGFAYGSRLGGGGKIPLITYSNEGYGQNVMIAQSVNAHFKSYEDLKLFINNNALVLSKGDREDIFKLFDDTHRDESTT